MLITKLLNIRNKIEYEGLNAPSLIECEELIDIVWYFYKTTDIFCKLSFDCIIIKYIINDVNYYIYLNFDFCNHEHINFKGLLPDNFINMSQSINSNILIDKYEEQTQKKLGDRYGKKHYSGQIKTIDINDYYTIVRIIVSRWGK